MKTKKLIALLLLASILASALQLVSCQNNTSASTPNDNPFTPDNPFQVETSAQSGDANKPVQTNVQSGENWTPNTSTGEKLLYGKQDTPVGGILRWKDMMIGLTNFSDKFGYFSINEPRNAKLICFDPLCLHIVWQESCAATTNEYFKVGDLNDYPNGSYIDLYESTESPVLYFFYRRNDNYTINIEENGSREPVYCIERYDLSKGHREAVLDNVKEMIVQACNYGDYIYYVLDMGENAGQMLYRIHKSGGESEQLDREENAVSIKLNDVVDEKLYYTVNERYIYSTNLDLTESQKVFDMAGVKGNDGSQGVIANIYCGYLYYFADVETVYANNKENSPSDQKCNLYRIPMNDLTKSPEMVVEGMIYAFDCYEFADKTLYYEPCVFKSVDVKGQDGLTSVNFSDGKLMALDLETGESKTIVEDSGLTIFPKMAWDDMVVFTAWAYDLSGKEMAGGNSNNIIAYTSGEPYKVWCKGGPCVVSKEYVEEIQKMQSAAREEYEASQKQG